MNLNKYSLSTRLLLSYALLFALAAMVGGFALHNMRTMMDVTDDIKGVKLPVIEKTLKLELLVNDFRRAELLHIIENDPKEMTNLTERMKQTAAKVEAAAEDLAKAVTLPENKKGMEDFNVVWARYMALHKPIEEASLSQNQKEAQALAVGDSLKAMMGAMGHLDAIQERSSKAAIASGELADTAYNRARNMSYVILGLAFGAAVFMTIYGNRTISRPLDQVAQTLSSASTETGAASSQLTSTSQTLANVAARGASSLEETAASLREIEKATNENVVRTESVSKLASEVRGKAETGNASMEKLVEAMGEILVANDRIQELVKVIEEIGEKTEIIDEIVFQTKLLSFNASVEAERAGEHGRGFAVVAQEVGNLATMSGKAALEISNIVKSSIKAAENVATENRRKVTQGDGLVKETAAVLQQINQAAGLVLDSAGEILQISRQSSNSIAQINTAVTHLDRDTQSMSANAEESAAAAAELDAQAASLSRIVSQLREFVNGQGAIAAAGFGFEPAPAAATHAQPAPRAARQGNVVPLARKAPPTPQATTGTPPTGAYPMKKAAGAEGDAWEEV